MDGEDGHDGAQQQVEQASSVKPCPSGSIALSKRIQGEDLAASGNMRDALECFKEALRLIDTEELPVSAATTSVKTASNIKKVNQQVLLLHNDLYIGTFIAAQNYICEALRQSFQTRFIYRMFFVTCSNIRKDCSICMY